MKQYILPSLKSKCCLSHTNIILMINFFKISSIYEINFLKTKKNWVNIIFNFSNARAKSTWLNVPVFYLICSLKYMISPVKVRYELSIIFMNFSEKMK